MRFIDPDGMQTIGYIKRVPYGNNILVNGLTFLENTSRAIVNTGIHAVNSVVSSYEIIRDDGLSGFVEAAGNDFAAMGSAIADGAKEIITNPSVVVETLTNPEFLEQATANVAMMFAGNSSMNSTAPMASKGAFAKGSATTTESKMTTVGRWMSTTEYEAMKQTGRVVEGAGGQTFVTTGGSNSFSAAAKGSVFVEFQVPTNSLLQGGKAEWYKVIGPSANKTMQNSLGKKGGEMLPTIKNLSPILERK